MGDSLPIVNRDNDISIVMADRDRETEDQVVIVKTSAETSVRTSLETSVATSLETSVRTSLETSVRTSLETSVRTSLHRLYTLPTEVSRDVVRKS